MRLFYYVVLFLPMICEGMNHSSQGSEVARNLEVSSRPDQNRVLVDSETLVRDENPLSLPVVMPDVHIGLARSNFKDILSNYKQDNSIRVTEWLNDLPLDADIEPIVLPQIVDIPDIPACAPVDNQRSRFGALRQFNNDQMYQERIRELMQQEKLAAERSRCASCCDGCVAQ